MIRVGIIGTGLIAREHAQAIAMTRGRVTLVAAFDVAPEKLSAFSAEFNVSRSHKSAADLMGDPGVDLVAITTPPSAHEASAVAALDAGKYVLCEKPLAHSLASARRIAAAAAKHAGKLSVSYQLRYDPSFRRLLWLGGNGWIGDLQSVAIERHGRIPHADAGKTSWWGAWQVAGGGVLMTQLIHQIDLLILALGRPLSVVAKMDTRYTTIESEDHIEASIKFEGGRTARCVATVNSGRLDGRFTVRGSKGSLSLPWDLTINDPSRVGAALAAVDEALPDTRQAPPSFARKIGRRLGVGNKPSLTAHARLYAEIARCVATGRPLPIPADAALDSLELCMATYEAAITGREITLPLAPSSSVFDGVSKTHYDSKRLATSAV